MTRTRNIHTVPSERGWANKEEGNPHPLSTHRTQSAAAERGRELARERAAEHLIHGRDGRIRERNSYGNDPFPPRG
ncbi:DUF2188 domain-containing protein [Elioraea thermophila]|uniref:DUF2188 domain-containing protein n=1 Tax=Elioraea thermophila TaxID=2185104 RepID=UPI000DF356FE|nr:DUF2188 domain-containing protein [Elioraea thermophila]